MKVDDGRITMNMEIKEAKPADLEPLFEFARANFIETYGHLNKPENMSKYLDETFSIKAFAKEFKHTESYFFIVWFSDQIIGYTKTNFGGAQTKQDQAGSCEIERIYIKSAHKGTGIGSKLFKTVIGFANSKNAKYIWLGVWEKNIKALTFYEKIGMKAYDTHTFVLGDDNQTDIMMRYDLIN